MDSKNKKKDPEKILNRISRIEGQLRGVKKMIEGHKNCVDVISQVLAVREAVSMLGIEILKDDFVCKVGTKKKIDEKYLKALFKVNK